METFTDYYEVLSVDAHSSPEAIRAAFKKLALQYHPDVYKGDDAEERMRLILLAYQTLSDPEARQSFDRQRAVHLGYSYGSASPGRVRPDGTTSSAPAAAKKKEQHGHFAFPDLDAPGPIEFVLEGFVYSLWPDDALLLKREGVLRGSLPYPHAAEGTPSQITYACHRCRHRWKDVASGSLPAACPNCHERDWADYLLLRCTHCHAAFESRELRDKIRGGQLYNPYELFPLCPNCRRPQWCPAEDTRVYTLRAAEARRRAVLLTVTVVAALIVVVGLALVFAR